MRNTACLQTIAQITEGFPPGGGSQGCPYTGWVLCWLVAFLRHLGGCWHRHGKQRRSCFSSQPKRGCFHVGLGKSRPWNRTDEVMWVMDKVSCRRISAGGSPHLVAWHWFLGFCSFRHRDMNFGMTKGIIWFLLSGWKIVNRSFLDDTPPLICNFKSCKLCCRGCLGVWDYASHTVQCQASSVGASLSCGPKPSVLTHPHKPWIVWRNQRRLVRLGEMVILVYRWTLDVIVKQNPSWITWQNFITNVFGKNDTVLPSSENAVFIKDLMLMKIILGTTAFILNTISIYHKQGLHWLLGFEFCLINLPWLMLVLKLCPHNLK